MSESMASPIEDAYDLLAAEIARRRLRGVEISVYDENWLSILLQNEDRMVWIGYQHGQGYFLTWDKEPSATHFFQLDQAGITAVLSIVPTSTASSSADVEVDLAARDLLDSITSPEPDPERIRDILEETPS